MAAPINPPLVELLNSVQRHARWADCPSLDVVTQLLGLLISNRSNRAEAVEDANRLLRDFDLELHARHAAMSQRTRHA
jgi:hypothetical protein